MRDPGRRARTGRIIVCGKRGCRCLWRKQRPPRRHAPCRIGTRQRRQRPSHVGARCARTSGWPKPVPSWRRSPDPPAATGGGRTGWPRSWGSTGSPFGWRHRPLTPTLTVAARSSARRRTWTIRAWNEACRLRDSKGLRDLAVLLGRPGEDVHVQELARATGLASHSEQPLLDARARREIGQRLADLDVEIDQARPTTTMVGPNGLLSNRRQSSTWWGRRRASEARTAG